MQEFQMNDKTQLMTKHTAYLENIPNSRNQEALMLLDKLGHMERLIREIRGEYEREVESLQDTIVRLQSRSEDLSRELQQTSDKYAKLLNDFHILHTGTLRAMKGQYWIKSDKEVREELLLLQEQIRGWARKYAFNNINALNNISIIQKNTIIRELEGYCIQDSWEALISCMSQRVANDIPYLLVNALLSKYVFQHIFSNPFFLFPENSSGEWSERSLK
jgi:hypothetical protein